MTSAPSDQGSDPVPPRPQDDPFGPPPSVPPPSMPRLPPLAPPYGAPVQPPNGTDDRTGGPGDGAVRTPSRQGARLWGVGLIGAGIGALIVAIVAVLATSDGGTETVVREPVATADGAMDVLGILDQVADSVVTIEATTFAQGLFGPGSGSGVVLSPDGLVLTNAHVVEDSSTITVQLADGTEHPASLVGSAPENDLAVIQMVGVEGLEPATLGSSGELRVGEPVVAIGNALGLDGQPTVTTGIVSAVNREIEDPERGVRLRDLIQTDAAINPGNSGGPLVDSRGEVVGINTAIVQNTQNIGFAIAMDSARPVIDQLQEGDRGVTPFLGVSTTPVDLVRETVLQELGVTTDEGVLVLEVSPGTGAEAAGLEPGDVIVAIDGEQISSPVDVGDAIGAREAGDEIRIVVQRRGQELTLTAELGVAAGG